MQQLPEHGPCPVNGNMKPIGTEYVKQTHYKTKLNKGQMPTSPLQDNDV